MQEVSYRFNSGAVLFYLSNDTLIFLPLSNDVKAKCEKGGSLRAIEKHMFLAGLIVGFAVVRIQ